MSENKISEERMGEIALIIMRYLRYQEVAFRRTIKLAERFNIEINKLAEETGISVEELKRFNCSILDWIGEKMTMEREELG